MDSLNMVKGGKFSLRGYVASICKDDPRKCWPLQSFIDYYEFRRLKGSTLRPTKVQSNQKGKEVVSINPAAAPNGQRKRGRNGNGSGSENPAAPNVESCGAGGNINNFNVEEDSDYALTVGEFISKLKVVNIKKNKKKRKALVVEGPKLFVAEPRPTVSSDRLSPSGAVLVLGVDEPRVQAPKMALAEPRPASSFDGLHLLSSLAVSMIVEPAEGVGGARAPAGPREHEVMVCRVSRNPAEFSTEHAKLFLRSL